MKRIVLAFVFLAVFVSTGFALDFGAALSGKFGAEYFDETKLKGGVTLAPWLSVPFGKSQFYVSAGAAAGYNKGIVLVPEVFRLEYSAVFFNSLFIRAGRIPWQDVSRLAAKGHFDGADIIYDFGRFRIGAAAFYTGLLYKETAYINKTPDDPKDYTLDFDWSDFTGTYFAPRRVIASLYGEISGFPNKRGNLYAALMAQFDLSQAPQKFNTQYALLRYSMIYRAFDVSASGAAGLQNTSEGGRKVSFAVSAEGGMQLPGALRDRLSLGFRWASGSGPNTAAFFPLINESQGQVLKPALSGIMVIRANYEVRVLPSLYTELRAKYFFRTDSSSFIDPYLVNNSYALGMEIAGGVVFVPFSDLSLSLSAGVYLPKTGGGMHNSAPTRWAISLGTVFTF